MKNIIKYISNNTNCPLNIKDPPNINKMFEGALNGGIYLWLNGYDAAKLKFLGAGGSGSVWKCGDNKAMKVVMPSQSGHEAIIDEINSFKEFQNMLSECKNKKWQKNI